MFLTLSFTVLVATTFGVLQVKAQLTQENKDFILNAHNTFRRGVAPTAANMLELQWNDELVNVAQTYAEGCEFEHNPNRVAQQGTFASVGENLGTRSSLTAIANADLQQLMTAWDNEKSDYNFQTNSCTAVCGHYTQVVWATTEFVGCGAALCPTLGGTSFTNALLLVCNYGPAGNFIGQQPYESGAACSNCPSEYSCNNGLCSMSTPSATDPPSSTSTSSQTTPTTTTTTTPTQCTRISDCLRLWYRRFLERIQAQGIAVPRYSFIQRWFRNFRRRGLQFRG